MNHTKQMRCIMLSLIATSVLAFAGTALTAHAQEVSTSYRGTGRDPFVKYKPPVRRKKSVSKVPVAVAPPSIQDRITQYKAQKMVAMNTQRPAPKPTTALLLNEVQVTGIFRTPRGYAAMVEATPISLSYVIYPGETFFDGLLVAIEENRLVFRRETKWSNGRRDLAVEIKPLRQPNAVVDSLTTTAKSTSPNTTSSETNGTKQQSAALSGNQ